MSPSRDKFFAFLRNISDRHPVILFCNKFLYLLDILFRGPHFVAIRILSVQSVNFSKEHVSTIRHL
jgi:hypothetical protein